MKLINFLRKCSDFCIFLMFVSWSMFRTYLKLPWRPLISINGNTVYDLDKDFKVRKRLKPSTLSVIRLFSCVKTIRLIQALVFVQDCEACRELECLCARSNRADIHRQVFSLPWLRVLSTKIYTFGHGPNNIMSTKYSC